MGKSRRSMMAVSEELADLRSIVAGNEGFFAKLCAYWKLEESSLTRFEQCDKKLDALINAERKKKEKLAQWHEDKKKIPF